MEVLNKSFGQQIDPSAAVSLDFALDHEQIARDTSRAVKILFERKRSERDCETNEKMSFCLFFPALIS
jgi:hypothetical protein